MAIKPILFNTKMVRAILDGKKSCSRRLVTTRRKTACGFYVTKKADGTVSGIYEYDENESMFDNRLMPPYQPRDILYVRETFAWCPCWDCGLNIEEGACKYEADRIYNNKKKEYGCYVYRASCEDNEYPSADTWHPSIHMPKEAARIWLKVTNVRVERLQEITLDDCYREGINIGTNAVTDGETLNRNHDFSLERFETLWDSTVKETDLDHYGWDANPWVWVIEFERCEKPEGV